MTNTFIDIETLPQQPENEAKALIAETIKAPAAMKKAETIEAWHNGEGKYEGEKDKLIEKTYRDTSFDGGKGELCSIAFSDNGALGVLSQSLKDGASERDLLLFLRDSLDGIKNLTFVGHNIRFDLKFLHHRFIINNINPNFRIPFSGRHGSDFYCTMEAWAGFKERISQDNLCKALGIEGKKEGVSGSTVYDYFKDGKIDEIEKYNIDDVETVIKMYNRLNFKG